jgi:alpha-tubulin suppressor-like RCC1 family protein
MGKPDHRKNNIGGEMRNYRVFSGAAILIAVTGSFLLGPGAAPAAAAPGLVAKQVATGFVSSCALSTKGAVRCWGYNGEGELGDGTKVDSPIPVAVAGLNRNVKAIAAGSYFTCALTTKGAVKCWGSNSYGQLGNNTTTDAAAPVAVYGLEKGIKAISAGNFFACALTKKGKVLCWGANNFGQLGNGTKTGSARPIAVSGLTKGIKSVGGGGYHACAVTSKGGVKCWGYNGEGGLGDNTKADSLVPVAVYTLGKGIKSVVAGSYSTCALTTKRTVKCWGYNGDGELGDGTTTGSLKPVLTLLGNRITSLAYGDIHGCAVSSSGIVKCWGYNGYGALGDNTTTTSSTPVQVYNMGKKVKSLGLGGYHSCAVTTKGALKCWGFNAYGQLGNNTKTTSHMPVDVYGTVA